MSAIWYCLNDECVKESKPLDYRRCCECEDAGRNPHNLISESEIEAEIQTEEYWADH